MIVVERAASGAFAARRVASFAAVVADKLVNVRLMIANATNVHLIAVHAKRALTIRMHPVVCIRKALLQLQQLRPQCNVVLQDSTLLRWKSKQHCNDLAKVA